MEARKFPDNRKFDIFPVLSEPGEEPARRRYTLLERRRLAPSALKLAPVLGRAAGLCRAQDAPRLP
jgi:hypothetical protein